MNASTPDSILRERFGLDAFRPGQRPVIEALLAGRSALAVFPTGGGKSLCYQLPALLLDGLTLVVSPLIALMKDQVDRLLSLGVPAARLDSTLDREQTLALYRALGDGSLKLLYVSPERLGNERFLARLGDCRISLLAIDEAHCISEWGHNFRPDYLKLAGLAERLRAERILALTATATPDVGRDIRARFAIAEHDHVQTSVRRDNLRLAVTPCAPGERPARLLERLRARAGDPCIVYVTLQKTAEQVAAGLDAGGLRAACYHAGMDDDARSEVQNRFMAGALDCVVATIAFGMGIDKADIRAIYHYNLPKSIENYMQEIGRAGRDGATADCEIFAAAEDLRVLANFSYGDTPAAESLAALLDEILAQPGQFSISTHELAQRFDIRPLVLSTALTYLELAGLIAATAPFYSGYKIAWRSAPEQIYAALDERRAEFLRRLFASGRPGRIWLALDIEAAIAATDASRERIQKALNWLEERGHIEVQASGVRQAYRRLIDGDRAALLAMLEQAFVQREENDIARLRQVLQFAGGDECLSVALQRHFGEQEGAPCGHCSSCIDPQPRQISKAPPYRFTDADLARIDRLLAEGRDGLRQLRQIARFLCGLSSPASSRGKFRQHPDFGALAEAAFPAVLRRIEQRAHERNGEAP
jgi:ATP-dependent DNA helicase RecQ